MVQNFFPGFVVSLREGLEMFLVIGVVLRVLKEVKREDLLNSLWYGSVAGGVVSIVTGLLLAWVNTIFKVVDLSLKLWESIMSFMALVLISTLIVWMIKYGRNVVHQVEAQTKTKLSRIGIFLLALVLVAREGIEIALFSFVGKYTIFALGIGLFVALVITILIYLSILRIPINKIFSLTLIYIILQAGYLLGYSVHEFLSYLKELKVIAKDSLFLIKVFDLSGGILDHKTGSLGLPLNVLVGWYSKPEWLQFVIQYLYTIFLSIYWYLTNKKEKKNER
jgi:high-affinity iron transporter